MRIGIIGLGYVGLPLSRLFATSYSVVGFDIDDNRISEINSCNDITLEVSEDQLKNVLVNKLTDNKGLFCTSNLDDLKSCEFYIVTVPTPVDNNKKPVLGPLVSASESVGKVISKNNIVVYESTVYPGATEEICVPIIENISGLKFNQDFFVGYSPERINPGDKSRPLENILKITSGSNKETAVKVDNLYSSVISGGTYMTTSIKVAEAAKVIENAQRDINIAFVNELSKIFNLMEINTHDVLSAASTKWNFINYKPGLVGGHCIGVDPYYLADRAIQFGYYPEIILAGRRMNDGMGNYIASETLKLIYDKKINLANCEILVMGITFKENCPDIRNTKVIDVIKGLKKKVKNIDVYDPWANPDDVKREFGFDSFKKMPKKKYDAIVLAVSHKEFKNINLDKIKKDICAVYDVKNIVSKDKRDKGL